MRIDNERFKQITADITSAEKQLNGIGTLGEKTVHAILKRYYSDNEITHEIPLNGYVADIFKDNRVIEIQTRSLNSLRNKLTSFLPLYPVTIVHPIARTKWLLWIDEESGQITKKRKSPVTGSPYHAFAELYKIKMFLKDPNLKVFLTLIDVEEYRLLNGWSKDKKKGSTRYDRIPSAIVEEIELSCPQDYMQLVPCDIKQPFTTKDFAKAVKITPRLAGVVLNLLHYMDVVTRIGKDKNAYLYEVMEYY